LSPSAQALSSPRSTQGEAAIAHAHALANSGHIADAATFLNRAADRAHQARELADEALILQVLSGCRIRLFDYRGAQQAALYSREIALKIQNRPIAGAASVNLATIYSQLGDYALASREATYGAQLLTDAKDKGRLAKALLIYADVEAERARSNIEAAQARGDAAAERAEIAGIEQNYRRGVDVAHAAQLPRQEANIWEELGYSLLLVHRPHLAEEPLARAFQLETSTQDEDSLAVNRAHQAELQLQQRNYQAALALIDQAFASHSQSFRSTPLFYPLHIRGVLLEFLNRDSDALIELKKAVDSATEWRQGALPGDATSTRTVVVLHDVYEDYAQLAAELSLKRNDPQLARQGLEVLAENRAANLRDQIKLALSQKLRLPQHYFDLLSELREAQAKVTLGENRPQDKAELERVRLEIGGIENEFGLKGRHLEQISEKNLHRNSLRDIQADLSGQEVLLSFCLGDTRSFLWAVTRDQVSVYRLAGEGKITILARLFAQSVQRQHQDASTYGKHLTAELFGNLPPTVWRKTEWLVVGDGALLDGIPFSALPDSSNTRPKPLINAHTLRYLPSELLLLSSDRIKPQPRFVGVGDPIYNMADARLKSGESAVGADRAAVALPRLAGSDHEVRMAARQSGMSQAQILVGAQATVTDITGALADHPEVLHFAVHVVSPEGRQAASNGSSQAALALSLTRNNLPELLTPEEIATFRVPGSLVILSGCSSQKAEVLPSAGLMGLSRAWLLAGAAAVVVSAWPTPDDSGKFFSSFYSHLGNGPSGTLAERAASALQQAQLDMEHGIGYRSAPKFWAAYSVISKE
jgi:CHAT domain-containing protein